MVSNAYQVRLRVYDAFYDLDNDASALEDTDDYAENIQILPLGKVALLLGTDYASIGNVADDTYNLTVGSRGINSLGPIKINGVDVGTGGGSGGGSSAAQDITIVDTGAYYTSGNVEGALQEVGSMMGDVGSILDEIIGGTI